MALSSCAHQDLAGFCLCNYTSVLELELQNQPVEKMMVIWTEGEYALETTAGEAHIEHGDAGEPREGTGSG